ncbi:uncharacterized protein LOC144468614 isoform X1 [Augochlora pura]
METPRKLNKFKLSSERANTPIKSNLSNTNIWKEHRYRTPKRKEEKVDLKTMKLQSVKKFSKSPKIVLKLKQSEELNLLGLKKIHRNKSLSPSNKKKSAVSFRIMNKTVSPSKNKTSKISRYNKNKTISPSSKRKSMNLNSTDIAAFIRENTIKDSLLLKNPVVVLHRLPNKIPGTVQEISKDISNNSWEIIDSRSTRLSPNNTSNFKRNNLNTSDALEVTALAINDEQNDGINKNNTYELIEPETPNLRQILRDRKNVKRKETNLYEKVRKSSLKENMNCTPKPALSSTPKRKEFAKESKHVMVVLTRMDNVSSTMSTFKKNSEAATNRNISITKSVTPSSKLRSDSKITKTRSPVSKKLGLKASAKKKVPRFAEIHKKLFAELESAVDAQQRLKERHRALTTPNAKKLPVSTVSPKNNFPTYNSMKSRIPCKIRLQDATNCIKKMEPRAELISTRQRKNREILKGVRSNRRFELQMKFRNIKN